MAKSAQQRFNEYLDECRETSNAVRSLVDRSYDVNSNYAYAAGFLSTMLQEAIAELPKARREDFRRRLLRQAEKFQQEMVDKQVA